jgi:hypothetical protein
MTAIMVVHATNLIWSVSAAAKPPPYPPGKNTLELSEEDDPETFRMAGGCASRIQLRPVARKRLVTQPVNPVYEVKTRVPSLCFSKCKL